MFADFRAEQRRLKVKDTLNRTADRGGGRAAEQDLRTWAMMPSGPVAESG